MIASLRSLALLSALVVLGASPARADHPFAKTSDGREMWVTNLPGGSVSVVDTVNRSLVREITFGGSPFSVAITPDDRTVFVTNPVLGQVIVIDRASRAIVHRIMMRGAPQDLVITPNGRFVYVTRRFMRAVSVIDVSSRAIVANLMNMNGRFQNQVRGLAVTNDGDQDDLDEFVWVSEFSASGSQIDLGLGNGARFRLPRLTKIAVANHAIVSQIELAEDPDAWYGGLPTNLRFVTLTPDQSEVWVVGEQANTFRGTRVGGPGGATPHPENDRAFVRSDDRFNGPGVNGTPPINPVVRRISTATDTELFGQRIVLSDERVGRTPVGSTRWAEWTPNGAYVYLVNTYSMDMTVLDATTLAEVAVVNTGTHANGVLFGPNQTAWVQALQDFGFHIFDVSNPALPVNVGFLSYVGTVPMPPMVQNGFRLFTAGHNPTVLPASPAASRVPQMACATCHPEGNSIGLVFDQTELGKGPRLTPDLTEWDQTGRFGWDAARDEVHDFINGAARRENGAGSAVFGPSLPDRTNDPAFGVGSNMGQVMGIDQMAMALNILFARTPTFLAGARDDDRSLRADAQRGFDVFVREGCADCHIPSRGFTDSGLPDPLFNPALAIDPALNPDTLKHDVGTVGPLDLVSPAGALRPSTGLHVGFDTPHLRHAFARLAFFHDGRALNFADVIHTLGANTNDKHAGAGYLGRVGTSGDATDLMAFLMSIDNTPFAQSVGTPTARINSTWSYRILGQPGSVPLVYLAFSGGEIRIPNVGTMLLDPNTLMQVYNGFAEVGHVQSTGEFRLDFPVPNDPQLIGFRPKLQSILFSGTFNDPQGLTNTQDLLITP